MKQKRLSIAIAAAALTIAATSAQAGLMISGGASGSTGPFNDVLGDTLAGQYGATLMVEGSSEAGTVTFEFIGSEAGWNSSFGSTSSSDTIVNHPAGTGAGVVLTPDAVSNYDHNPVYSANAGYQQSYSIDVAANNSDTILDFFIDLTSGNNSGMSVVNGANNCRPGSSDVCASGSQAVPNYWLGEDPANAGSILIAMDDGGAGIDDNHDDLVVRATYATVPVPEPGSVALLGLGLIGLGLARRRKQ